MSRHVCLFSAGLFDIRFSPRLAFVAVHDVEKCVPALSKDLMCLFGLASGQKQGVCVKGRGKKTSASVHLASDRADT